MNKTKPGFKNLHLPILFNPQGWKVELNGYPVIAGYRQRRMV